jgi:hypothetical protein
MFGASQLIEGHLLAYLTMCPELHRLYGGRETVVSYCILTQFHEHKFL